MQRSSKLIKTNYNLDYQHKVTSAIDEWNGMNMSGQSLKTPQNPL